MVLAKHQAWAWGGVRVDLGVIGFRQDRMLSIDCKQKTGFGLVWDVFQNGRMDLGFGLE